MTGQVQQPIDRYQFIRSPVVSMYPYATLASPASQLPQLSWQVGGVLGLTLRPGASFFAFRFGFGSPSPPWPFAAIFGAGARRAYANLSVRRNALRATVTPPASRNSEQRDVAVSPAMLRAVTK
jgi:hypothetical protein